MNKFKKNLCCLALLVLITGQSTLSESKQGTAPTLASYFFAYDTIGNLIYPWSPPPTVLPSIPIGYPIRPYYAEYTSYYLNTTTSPWRYEPAGYLLDIYYGPIDYPNQ